MEVNGKPAKGISLTRLIVVNLNTNASAGQSIGDVDRTNAGDRILEILRPDGTRLAPSECWD